MLYLVVLGWTFLEGETVVIILGALASEGKYNINITMMVACACLGSFAGDQFYYYLGRKYGDSILDRFPKMRNKIDWAFKLTRENETLFILSFRFIYGVRNVTPFVIGIAGVPRLRFFVLNFIAAFIWANSFAWGGYLLGRALEMWLGEHKLMILGGFIALGLLVWGIKKLIRK